MNAALLIDMFYAAPELWYALGMLLLVLLAYLGWREIKILQLRATQLFSKP